jgi:hypothetical protein
MNENDVRRKEKRGARPHYRDTLSMLRAYLRPVKPGLEFTRRLEELCESMGAEELFLVEAEQQGEGGHRGFLIGGAIFSALPFLGVAAYAIRKHVLRRRVVPLGV